MATKTTVDKMILQYITQGENALRNSLRRSGRDVDTLEAKFERIERRAGTALSAGGAILGGVALIGGASLKAAGEVEMVDRALTRSLGSASAAQKKIAELRQFAKEAPQFNFVDSARSFQMLQAMGMDAEKIIPLMKGVGNAVAAAGGGNEQFQRSMVQLGQLVSKGRVQGEEILTLAENGIPAARILAKELGLTAEQVGDIGKQGITAKQAIDALTRGMDKEFGGAMKANADTLQGTLAAFQDATEQMLAAGGKSFIPIATKGIESATTLIEKLDDFATRHPDIVKYGLIGGAATGAGLIGYGGYLKLITLLGQARIAKDALTKSTKADTAAEAAKTLVAGREGRAIGAVGDIAETVAGSKGKLARETGKAAGKMGLLAKMADFVNRPLAPAMSTVPQLKRGAYIDPMAFYTTRSGKLATRSQLFPSGPANAGKLALARSGAGTSRGLHTLAAFGRGGGALTGADALMGGLAGVGAGVSAFGNWKAMGDSTGEAIAKASVTGITAGLGAAFVPGGPIVVAVGEGMGWAVNTYFNKPLEEAAKGLISAQEAASLRNMSTADRADFYRKKADEGGASPGLLSRIFAPNLSGQIDAGNAAEAALMRGRGAMLDRRAREEAEAKAKAEAEAQRQQRNRQADWDRRINTMPGINQGPKAHKSRNDGWTIKLPPSPADTSNRNLKFTANTPAPAYL